MDVIKNLEEFIDGQTLKVRQKVRDKAIKKAESKLIYHRTKQEDLTLEEWEHVVAEEEIAYVGDDILDLPVLQRVGLPIAVQNARPEVRNKCYYTSNASGGHGAIREIVDWLLDLRNERQVIIDYYTNSG